MIFIIRIIFVILSEAKNLWPRSIRLLWNTSVAQDDKLPLLFKQNTSKDAKNLLIVVAGDKGLAGSYNSNMLRAVKE
ncbi:MAG TPA: hypothetical protein VJL27_02020, partial [Patescibacteria group bacterium]|nr:hypothetical protein [Patescibacteria group bacterium]